VLFASPALSRMLREVAQLARSALLAQPTHVLEVEPLMNPFAPPSAVLLCLTIALPILVECARLVRNDSFSVKADVVHAPHSITALGPPVLVVPFLAADVVLVKVAFTKVLSQLFAQPAGLALHLSETRALDLELLIPLLALLPCANQDTDLSRMSATESTVFYKAADSQQLGLPAPKTPTLSSNVDATVLLSPPVLLLELTLLAVPLELSPLSPKESVMFLQRE